MKILLADHFGMCFGVRDAIAQAEQLATEQPLTILGELVHNPIVRERLRAQGIEEAALDSTRSASRRVMITAHGASDKKRAEWRTAGFDVADATCPLVLHAHEQLRRLVAAGYFPIVIGQRGHVEVNGLVGDFPGAFVVNSPEDVAKPSDAQALRSHFANNPTNRFCPAHCRSDPAHVPPDRKFASSIPSANRRRIGNPHSRTLIQSADAIVVVGGRTSNNTRQLVETCHAAGKTAFHIERPEELRP